MHLTSRDEVNVMSDEFTCRVRPLVTCATSWWEVIRLILMLHVVYPPFDLIQKISEVADEVEGL